MAIPYFIYQAPLGQKSRYLGRLLLRGTYNREALVNRMLDMGSSLTKPDITAVLELLTAAVGRICAEGSRVDLEGVVKITPTLGGSFDGMGDSFQAPRNSLYLTAQVSQALNKPFIKQAKASKVTIEETRPLLVRVADSEADSGISSLTPGHIISVTGKRLKFDPGQPGEYLRLVNANDRLDFVAVSKLHKITSQELVFRLPEVVFSEAYFELASYLKSLTLRIGQSQPFTIASDPPRVK